MTNDPIWSAEPPEKAGKYWVDGDFVNNLKGLTLVGVQVLRLGVRGRWFYGAEYVQATKSSRFGPRIPSPAELAAMGECVEVLRAAVISDCNGEVLSGVQRRLQGREALRKLDRALADLDEARGM